MKLLEVNGGRLAYWDSGRGAPLVFIHGMATAGDCVGCITSDENQLTMATGRGAVPSKTAVAEQAAAENPLIEAFVSTVQTARARTALLGEEWPDAATRIYTAVQLALTDKLSPEEALKQAQAE